MTLGPQHSVLSSPAWEFWIDVGGTFTDCIARSPDDELITVKILSSGITKGQVESIIENKRVSDSATTSAVTKSARLRCRPTWPR